MATSSWHQQTLRRCWPWLLLLLAVAYAGAHWVTRVIPESVGRQRGGQDRAFMDFDVYLTGARQLAVGRSVYAPTDTLPRPPCVGEETLEYIYTPLLALLLRPWTALSACSAERWWFALNVLACAALPPLLMLALRMPGSPAAWALAVFLTAAPMATLETVSLGQINAMILALILVFAILADRGRPLPASLALALATGLKVVPVMLGLVALRRGRHGLVVWLAATTGCVLFLAFAAAPSSTPAAFLGALDQRTVGGIALPNNASWVGAAARAYHPGPGAVHLLVRANLLLVLLVAALAWWRARADHGAARIVALGCALAVAMSPVFESHHQMLLVPGLMVLALAMSREPRARGRVAGAVGLVLLAALLNSRGLVPAAGAHGLPGHLLVKPAGVALWLLIAWLLCLRADRLE